MKIIIVGCGRVGAQLAEMLSQEGHEVAIIDKDPTSARRLGKSFQGRFIQGVGFDRESLLKAGIEHADGFASVTSGDNTNIVAALAARDHFHVPRVVARIADPRRAEIYRRFGIPTISPTTWGAFQIKDALCHCTLTSLVSLGSGEVEVVETLAPPALVGKPATVLSYPGEILLAAIVRTGQALIPTPDTILAAGDGLRIAVASPSMSKLEKILGGQA